MLYLVTDFVPHRLSDLVLLKDPSAVASAIKDGNDDADDDGGSLRVNGIGRPTTAAINTPGYYTVAVMLRITEQIFAAVAHMHSRDVCHRDLKPQVQSQSNAVHEHSRRFSYDKTSPTHVRHIFQIVGRISAGTFLLMQTLVCRASRCHSDTTTGQGPINGLSKYLANIC